MSTEHVDVVIVGAGLSGIGAACHLQDKCPGKRYLILEGRGSIGGTWDLFRYPGIRSDSDMHTLGFNFKPWRNPKAIADGPAIMDYMQETVAENRIGSHIRLNQLVTGASWCSKTASWTVSTRDSVSGDCRQVSCNFLMMCAGYYSYKEGYTPEFPGRELFRGPVIHPQQWPEDLDYSGKRVVIIGSGATAMTLVPAMARDAAQVTMLQRSPTWVISRPDRDWIANLLRRLMPERWAYALSRWKNVLLQQWLYRLTRRDPEKVSQRLLAMVREELGPDYDVDTHFTPRYNPWDQRLCLVPNSDLFEAIRSGKAEVVTDYIDTFTEGGIRLKSGRELAADIIVTATGLNLVVMGEAKFEVDGVPIDFSRCWTYRGLMFSDVPNLSSSFGYINASWTLRADLIAEFVCRLINHMDATGTRQVTPRLRDEDRAMQPRQWIEDFSAGYMERFMHRMPRQGDREPWINPQDYRRDKKMFRHGPLEDGVLEFSNPGAEDTAGTGRDSQRAA